MLQWKCHELQKARNHEGDVSEICSQYPDVKSSQVPHPCKFKILSSRILNVFRRQQRKSNRQMALVLMQIIFSQDELECISELVQNKIYLPSFLFLKQLSLKI